MLDASAAAGKAAAPAAAPDPATQAPEPHSNRLNKWLQTADTLAGEVEEPWTLSTQVAWELERWPEPQPTADIEAVPEVPDGQLRLTFDDGDSSAAEAPAPERAGEAVEEIDDIPVVAALRKTFAKSAAEPEPRPAGDAAPPAAGPAKAGRVLAPAFVRKPAQPAASPVRTPSRSVTTAAAALVVVAAVGFPVLTKLRAGTPPAPAAVVAEAPAPAAPRPAETTPEPAAPARTEPERPVEPPAKPRTDRGRSSARSKPKPKIVLPAPRLPEATPLPSAVAVGEPVVVAAPPPPPAREPVAPAGPFFEMRDVQVPPQIVTRVDPVVPAGVAGPVNEIVVVRVLVSQAGQPSMARLLRASKTGPAIDNAVIKAVHQWTFVPAQRRGVPVSCWYHVGVPVRSR